MYYWSEGEAFPWGFPTTSSVECSSFVQPFEIRKLETAGQGPSILHRWRIAFAICFMIHLRISERKAFNSSSDMLQLMKWNENSFQLRSIYLHTSWWWWWLRVGLGRSVYYKGIRFCHFKCPVPHIKCYVAFKYSFHCYLSSAFVTKQSRIIPCIHGIPDNPPTRWGGYYP